MNLFEGKCTIFISILVYLTSTTSGLPQSKTRKVGTYNELATTSMKIVNKDLYKNFRYNDRIIFPDDPYVIYEEESNERRRQPETEKIPVTNNPVTPSTHDVNLLNFIFGTPKPTEDVANLTVTNDPVTPSTYDPKILNIIFGTPTVPKPTENVAEDEEYVKFRPKMINNNVETPLLKTDENGAFSNDHSTDKDQDIEHKEDFNNEDYTNSNTEPNSSDYDNNLSTDSRDYQNRIHPHHNDVFESGDDSREGWHSRDLHSSRFNSHPPPPQFHRFPYFKHILSFLHSKLPFASKNMHVERCLDFCRNKLKSENLPVCGSDGVTYDNSRKCICAKICRKDSTTFISGSCGPNSPVF